MGLCHSRDTRGRPPIYIYILILHRVLEFFSLGQILFLIVHRFLYCFSLAMLGIKR
jgi:hypothetical protein